MSIYAVFETGGKQYRVQPGDVVEVEKLEGAVGTAIKFDRVLMTSTPGTESSKITLGKPLLSGGTVDAEVVGQGRGEKVMIVKMKRRKQYRRTQGHRQFQTQLLITGINSGAGDTGVLSAGDKKSKLDSFYSQLTPKGLGHTPKKGSTRRPEGVTFKASAPAEASMTKKKTPAAKKTTATKKKTSK